MGKYSQSLAILNRLIASLQASTGGEPSLPEEQAPALEQKKEKKTTKANTHVQEIKEEGVEKAKKEGGKKKKEEGAKQGKKKDNKQAKLPQGADEDLLIFSDVDLRVSEIVDCWKHPESDYLYCQKILVGKELRQIASGLQDHVPLQGMRGKVIVMANLKPRPLGGFESNGMVVCASDKEQKSFELLVPQGDLGERLYLEGFEELFPGGEEVRPIMKKKTLERCLVHFATDKDGFVVWKGIRVRTKAGYIKSKFIDGSVS